MTGKKVAVKGAKAAAPSALPWFRMYAEAVDDEKLRLLAFEDRWHFVALLCCKGKGIIDAEPGLMRRMVAVKLGLDMRSLEEVARRLAEVGLIEEETLQPLAWNDRQFLSDSSTERVRAHRERVKRSRNVAVTVQDTDTDADTEPSLPSHEDERGHYSCVHGVSFDSETGEIMGGDHGL